MVFTGGLNVITGPSNTGKSYILDCIDYMLGAKKPPRDIDEGKGFNNFLLELEDSEGTSYTLRRSREESVFTLFHSILDGISTAYSEPLLDERAQNNKNNISDFLNGLCGMQSVKIKTNQNNKLEELSFRTISHFFIISESQIIDTKSPIAPKNSFEASKVKQAFKFILTGNDDSELKELPDPEIVKAINAGKLEAYDQIIAELESKIGRIGIDLEINSKKIEDIRSEIDQVTANITASSKDILEQQSIREKAWIEQREEESKILHFDELLNRFDLLKQTYQSDRRRLEFTSEGNFYFSQLRETVCPVCGKPLDTHEVEKVWSEKQAELVDIEEACIQEISKIDIYLRDLEKTIISLFSEKEAATIKAEESRKIITQAEKHIAQVLQPQEITSKNQFAELRAAYLAIAEVESNVQQLNDLKEVRAALKDVKPEKRKRSIESIYDKAALQNLCNIIGQILVEWNYLSSPIVYFSEKTSDLVIVGKDRQSNGKGVRALTHSAFTLGLMRYCTTYGFPHPNFVILDSPVTTYKESRKEGQNEDIEGEIQAAFWENLSLTPKTEQIIILENKEPSLKLLPNVKTAKEQNTSGKFAKS